MTSPDRRRVELTTPRHGWDHPWPNLFELANSFDTSKWTLVGGLMVQAHAIRHDIIATRPTADLDLLLHVEVETAVANEADEKLTRLGYELQEPFERNGPHYRYLRGEKPLVDKIDVMAADHAAPRVRQELRGRRMFAVDGGTQALRRTMIYAMRTPSGASYDISVPDELGALVLKGAAHLADRRDRDRHLTDAAVLSACITDHAGEMDRTAGSDRKRIKHLAEALADHRHQAWLTLDQARRTAGQDTLRILSADPRRRTAFG